jgi:hypothetical protein
MGDPPPPPPPDEWEEDAMPSHFGRFQKVRGEPSIPAPAPYSGANTRAPVGRDPHELDSILVNDHDYMARGNSAFNFDPYQQQHNPAYQVSMRHRFHRFHRPKVV